MNCVIEQHKWATQPLFERVTRHLCPICSALSSWDLKERANVGWAASPLVSPAGGFYLCTPFPYPEAFRHLLTFSLG